MYKLREIQRDDLQIVNLWRNDHDLMNSLAAPFRYINIEVDNKWYDNYMQNRNTNIRCAIINTNRDDELIGLVGLTNIDLINQCAEISIMIGNKEDRGKGVGYFAMNEIVKHGFLNMNLNRIELFALENNTQSIKLCEKIGFIHEGIKRKLIYKNGKYWNAVIMGLLKEEYELKHLEDWLV